MPSLAKLSLRSSVAGCALLAAVPTTLLNALPAAAGTSYQIQCQETGKPCRETETLLPLRVLPRPSASIFKSKDSAPGNVAVENVPAFRPLFVFAREGVDYTDPTNPKGWYQVGGGEATPEGWMPAKDVMEWRQALVVAYTHPGVGREARHPVLMFDNQAALEQIALGKDRESEAGKIYEAVEKGEKPKSVVSIEPKRFADIEDNFYVLPVLDFKSVTKFDDETRLLQLAAAVPGKRSDETNQTTLGNAAYAQASAAKATLSGDAAKGLRVDIVFVMDLTGSMGPFVESTKTAITDLTRAITKDPMLKEAVRFGIVGYRDDLRVEPKLEFVSKNFTPTLLQDTDFVSVIDQQVRASAVSSDDYAEEGYAGVKTALNETAWTDGALRFMVMVGDASAHEPGHKQSTTRLSAAELRHMANDQHVSVFSVHLKAQRYAKDHPKAEEQFSTLANNPGTSAPALFSFDADKPDEYATVVKQISSQLSELVDAARKGREVVPDTLSESATVLSSASSTAGAPAGGDAELKDEGWNPEARQKELLGPQADRPEVKEQAQKINEVAAAALINYLGGDTVRDLTFWAMDRDLIDPRKKALDVRVLVSKTELNDLIGALQKVTDALSTAEVAQLEFFTALQSVMAQTTTGTPIDFEKAQKLSQTELMPKWIEKLPYRSAIMEMNNATYEALTPDERVTLEQSLQSKLQYYVEVNANVDAWKVLDGRGADTAKVYALPLDALP
ncbi:hypothetical protein FHW79_003165 [Azospirillum sp. OGB3]|uniref:vWA domain-containing protein n=1 Tax=Azospirillum sp. OGB3 TaxID=2587012 RepID=UPI001605D528|nr:vWA domain-containing protein [Azospirillum sp. OGB3]MBB3265536.1 hypothetical protein [Azospirillum sp. OGB3]